MKNNSTRKLLTAIFLTVLLISSAYAAFTPNVHAAEVTTKEKGLSILNVVVGLNTSAYTAYLNSDVNATTLGLPQEDTNFNLISAQGSLRARVVFANNSLRLIYISDYVGSPSFTQPATNAVDMAKGFLERYQRYTGDSVYSQLNSMLDGVVVNTNVTKIAGNVKLEATIVGDQDEENFVWTFVDENGVPALSKNMVLSYHHGLLQSFLDNWQFYKIAGVPKISSQDAVAAALKAVPSLSYTVRTDSGDDVGVSGFKVVSVGNVTLSYLNYNEETSRQSVRGGDPFTLYPSWYVALGFDKVYLGSITGARVRVWADTGEVSIVDPMVYDGSSDNLTVPVIANIAPSRVFFFVTTLAVGGAIGLYLYGMRDERLGLKRSWKKGLSKPVLALLCALTLLSPMLIMAQEVNATGLKSEIYGSTHGQLWDEFVAGGYVTDCIEDYFEAAGVETDNNFGGSTTLGTVTSNIQYDVSNFAGVTVFHWGHGYYNYYDSEGTEITPYAISSAMSYYTNHYFILMWTCNLAAAGPSSGFPYAWTKNYDMAENGYVSPNDCDQCFIGFTGASPALSYQSFRYYSTLAKNFIISFYDFAVNYGYSVHDSLNEASLDRFSCVYTESPLYEGYETWWPYNEAFPEVDEGWYEGNMEVYGDSNVHLLAYSLLSDVEEYEGGGWVDNAEYIMGSSNDGNFAHIHCPNSPDMAVIFGTMNTEASGHIEIYGKSGPGGYYSNLYVYVADEYPSENWQFVNMLTITNTSPYWIDVGTPSGVFRYIAVVGYDSANSVCLYLDSVRVTP